MTSGPSASYHRSPTSQATRVLPPHFLCNICDDVCCDPVVTMCGHLFCWPCLYHTCTSVPRAEEASPCPVCHQDVRDRILPIYGCGRKASSALMAERFHGRSTPCRPSPPPVCRSVPPFPSRVGDSESPIQHPGIRQEHRAYDHLGETRFDDLPSNSQTMLYNFHNFTTYMLHIRSRDLRRGRGSRLCNEKERAVQWATFFFVFIASIGFLVC
ncbi:hypothetical protein KP509_10G009800 [Ceratopteris richardii]|uniref:RING-type E3 ubiquitin transferase n=1 Tax=Ceratopteris richardii TaxID=49495 RepID=A0A8T2TYJ9_CERRI|nr:hypothetical protein KP509_10G009800 [Ceratopteris richardii]